MTMIYNPRTEQWEEQDPNKAKVHADIESRREKNRIAYNAKVLAEKKAKQAKSEKKESPQQPPIKKQQQKKAEDYKFYSLTLHSKSEKISISEDNTPSKYSHPFQKNESIFVTSEGVFVCNYIVKTLGDCYLADTYKFQGRRYFKMSEEAILEMLEHNEYPRRSDVEKAVQKRNEKALDFILSLMK